MTEQSNRRRSVDLADQVAIVTGAARGLGQTIARDIAASGAKVACVDVNEGLLAETVERITAAGGGGLSYSPTAMSRRGRRGCRQVGIGHPRQQCRGDPR